MCGSGKSVRYVNAEKICFTVPLKCRINFQIFCVFFVYFADFFIIFSSESDGVTACLLCAL